MSKDPEKIRQQIQLLKDDLKEAKKNKEQSAKKSVARAAERAGLHKLDVSIKDLETEFKAIATKLKQAPRTKPTAAPGGSTEPPIIGHDEF